MIELLRTHDAVRARLVHALLEEEGIPAETPGLAAMSVMPHLESALVVIVRVPASEIDRARALVAEMERADEEAPGGDYRSVSGEGGTGSAGPARLKRLTILSSFVFPGGAHIHTQRYRDAALVVLGYATVVAAIWARVPASGFLIGAVWLGDVTGGLAATDLANGGPAGSIRLHAPLAAIACVLAWWGLAMGPLLPTLAGAGGRASCRAYVACGVDLDERACLRDAANGVIEVLPPACAECVASEGECDVGARACGAVCSPSGGERPIETL